MYTHICVETAINPKRPDYIANIKKGDYCTFVEARSSTTIDGGIAWSFKEDEKYVYTPKCFLPLPPQQEKTVYVAVSEQLVESVPEPVLN